jgi:type II restriction enzyme
MSTIKELLNGNIMHSESDEERFKIFLDTLHFSNRAAYYYNPDYNPEGNNVMLSKAELRMCDDLYALSKDFKRSKIQALFDRHPEYISMLLGLLILQKDPMAAYEIDEDTCRLIHYAPGNCSPVDQVVDFMAAGHFLDCMYGTGGYCRDRDTLVGKLTLNKARKEFGRKMSICGQKQEGFIRDSAYRAGFINGKNVIFQATPKAIYEDWGINVPDGKEDGNHKRYDTVFKINDTAVCCETNFYNSGGSKVTETPRGYTLYSEKFVSNQHAVFMVVTDGIGWCTAAKTLKDYIADVQHVYNNRDVKDGLFSKLHSMITID